MSIVVFHFQCTHHFQQAIQSCESREVRDRLLTMAARLIFSILNEYRLYIYDLYTDIDTNNKDEQRPWIHYKQTRTLLLRIFSTSTRETFSSNPLFSSIFFLVNLKEFNKGKQLAEEFEDYLSMIEICDELKDVEQLKNYINEFKEKVKSIEHRIKFNRIR